MSINTEWTLTPGLDLVAAEAALERANIKLTLDSFDATYSSYGSNLARLTTATLVRRLLRTDYGPAALTKAPYMNGTVLTIPAQPVIIDGEIVRLCGASDDLPLTIETSSYANGSYAVVLETWESLVGATTTSALAPTDFPGVVEGDDATPGVDNKLTSRHLYPLGNVDRTSLGVHDGPFGDANHIQEQKFIQTQYRVRVIVDSDLVGSTIPTVPGDDADTPARDSYTSDPLLGGFGVKANANATDKAFDALFRAVKLCLVVKGGISVTTNVYTYYTLPDDGSVSYSGQPPLPYFADRGAVSELLYDLDRDTRTALKASGGEVIKYSLPADNTYRLIATLPPPALAGSHKLFVEIAGGSEWGASGMSHDYYTVSNQASEPKAEWVRAGGGSRNLGLAVFKFADGTAKVYTKVQAGTASMGWVKAFGYGVTDSAGVAVTDGGSLILGADLSDAPTGGALKYDSTDLITYPPTIDLSQVPDHEARIYELEHPTISGASETSTGPVRLATAAETVLGDDQTKATHPKGVKAAIDAIPTASASERGMISLANFADLYGSVTNSGPPAWPSGDSAATNYKAVTPAALAAFAGVRSTNGYVRLPNGLIIQWFVVAAIAPGTSVATYPVAFPGGVLTAQATTVNSDASIDSSIQITGTMTTTGVTLHCNYFVGPGTSTAIGAQVLVLGW